MGWSCCSLANRGDWGIKINLEEKTLSGWEKTNTDKTSCRVNRKQCFFQGHSSTTKYHNASFLWVTAIFLFKEKLCCLKWSWLRIKHFTLSQMTLTQRSTFGFQPRCRAWEKRCLNSAFQNHLTLVVPKETESWVQFAV